MKKNGMKKFQGSGNNLIFFLLINIRQLIYKNMSEIVYNEQSIIAESPTMLKYVNRILLFFCPSKIWKNQCNDRKYKEKHNYWSCKKS